MTATIQRAPANVAVVAPAKRPDDRLAYHPVQPAEAADAAVAPTTQEARLMVFMCQVVATGRPETVPPVRTASDADAEEAPTWEDAAWQ